MLYYLKGYENCLLYRVTLHVLERMGVALKIVDKDCQPAAANRYLIVPWEIIHQNEQRIPVSDIPLAVAITSRRLYPFANFFLMYYPRQSLSEKDKTAYIPKGLAIVTTLSELIAKSETFSRGLEDFEIKQIVEPAISSEIRYLLHQFRNPSSWEMRLLINKANEILSDIDHTYDKNNIVERSPTEIYNRLNYFLEKEK